MAPGGLDRVEAGGGARRRRPATPVTRALTSASVPTWLSKGPAPSACTVNATVAALGERATAGCRSARPRSARWRRRPAGCASTTQRS